MGLLVQDLSGGGIVVAVGGGVAGEDDDDDVGDVSDVWFRSFSVLGFVVQLWWWVGAGGELSWRFREDSNVITYVFFALFPFL